MSFDLDMSLSLCYFVTFRTRYVRWILLIHLTPPYGLILPGLAPGLPYKLGNRCLPALAGAMPPSPKQARVSKLPQALRVACSNGGNLAFPPARPPPLPSCRRISLVNRPSTYQSRHAQQPRHLLGSPSDHQAFSEIVLLLLAVADPVPFAAAFPFFADSNSRASFSTLSLYTPSICLF